MEYEQKSIKFLLHKENISSAGLSSGEFKIA